MNGYIETTFSRRKRRITRITNVVFMKIWIVNVMTVKKTCIQSCNQILEFCVIQLSEQTKRVAISNIVINIILVINKVDKETRKFTTIL